MKAISLLQFLDDVINGMDQGFIKLTKKTCWLGQAFIKFSIVGYVVRDMRGITGIEFNIKEAW